MLVLVRSFSYTGQDIRRFFYTPDAIYTPEAMFGEEFLLHSWC